MALKPGGDASFRPWSLEGFEITSFFFHEKSRQLSSQSKGNIYLFTSTAIIHVFISANGADPSRYAL
jgi:hypothetical protein